MASLVPNSCILCGSLKDVHTSLASFLLLSLPGTVDSLGHHSRVSHLSAFHGTHQLISMTEGSGDVSSSLSSEVFGNPLKKEATIGFSSSGSSKSEPLPLDPCPLNSVLGSAVWLGTGRSSKLHLVAPLLSPLSTWSLAVPALRSSP